MFQLHQTVFAALGLAAVVLIVALPVRGHLARSLRGVLSAFDGLGPLRKFAVLALVAHLTMFAGGKHGGANDVDGASGGTNEVDGLVLGSSPSRTMECLNFHCTTTISDYGYSPPTVTPEDIARLWQLWEVRTNLDVCYTMPEGATMASNWWVRGAFEDVVRVPGSEFQIPSFRFPYGSNEYCSAWVFSWGKLRFELGNTNTEIAAVGATMSAVPYRSRLWTAETTNSTLITWEDFTLGRELVATNQLQSPILNPQTLVSAQIELAANGDFITRSNGVETVYRRINPEDWDDDGWHNDDDPDPHTGEDFYDDFWQELPEGDYACNYCWIEIRPQWNSWIVFEGDGPSNLDDPCFWGKAGETYRVQLLIGKTYGITSTQPLSVVGRSSEAIEVSGDGTCGLSVVWPVTFTIGEGRYTARHLLGATWNDGGRTFHVLRDPSFLRGTNVWWDGCCSITGDGTNFTFACDNECTCEGCTAYGYFTYSGYTLSLPGWFECGCHYVEDQGPAEIVDISFDKSAAIYEESYTNRPGEVVHPFPSNVMLRCEARGGTYGGWLTVTLNDKGMEKIVQIGGDALPNHVHVQAGEVRTFETVYTPQEPSDDVGDIVASAIFTENFSNERCSNSASLTSLKVELTAVYEAPENPNPHRHVFGVGEKVKLKHWPESASVTWSLLKEGLLSRIDDGADCDKVFTETLLQEIPASTCLRFGNAEYVPATGAVDPTGLVCRVAAWNGMCLPKGRAGGQGMDLTLYVEPMYVSFRGIDIYEAPCTNALPLVGYFDTMSYEGEVSHTFDAGAGFWHHVKVGNYWSIDSVTSAERTREWSDGEMTWNIPIGWREPCENGDWPRGVLHYTFRRLGSTVIKPQDKYKQIYTLNSLGETGVSKHGHSIVRTTNDVIRLDGVIVHEGCDK